MNHTQPTLFLDFDGTISDRDAIDEILERHADPAWELVEAEWRDGRIGSRECLARQVALVGAGPAEVDAVLDRIGVDPGFRPVLDVCRRLGIAAHVVSDGFDYCIRHILSRAGHARAARELAVYSSRLAWSGERWSVAFPWLASGCEHGCATCKPAVMRELTPSGSAAIFVGDGLSDRHAAAAAAYVFAKGSLARHCDERLIPYTPYEGLAEVAAALERFAMFDTAIEGAHEAI